MVSNDVKIVDTLNDSRLIWSDMKAEDFKRDKASRGEYPLPTKLFGRHSLESWGYRLGCNKGEFGQTTDWAEWSPEMQAYCEQDLRVNLALYQTIEKKNYSAEARQMEYDFQEFMFRMERNGVGFNLDAATKLYSEIRETYDRLKTRLQEIGPETREEMKTPAYWLDPDGGKHDTKKAGVAAGWAPVMLKRGPNRVKVTPFNPGSRQQLIEYLLEHGWEPEEYTDAGNPRLNEEAIEKLVHLDTIPSDLSSTIRDFFRADKVLSMLSRGNQAWLKKAEGDRIHGSIKTNGAVTGRCTHSHPNLGQVPGVMTAKTKDGKKKILKGIDGKYGFECRSLFIPSPGNAMVGADASGLELRCLAHYLARWDKGAFASEILSGDIHTMNQNAAGLDTRDQAKTFIYALLYGGGDEKIGSIVLPNGTKTEQRERGAELKAQFFATMPAFEKFLTGVKRSARIKKKLRGLDGRWLPVRAQHAAPNTLLQSAGAMIMKRGGLIADRRIREEGLRDARVMLHVHDEYQYEVHPDDAQRLGEILVQSFADAGKHFNFRMAIDGEYKIGRNWAETH